MFKKPTYQFLLVVVLMLLAIPGFSQVATDSLPPEGIIYDSVNKAQNPLENGPTVQTKTKLRIDSSAFNGAVVYDTLKTTPTDSAKASGTQKKAKRHSPLLAAVFSAALPGLGQGYNKKYWKIPIVYAGFGGLGYALYYTAHNFTVYRAAYRIQVDGDPDTQASVGGISDEATLKSYRDYYKRYLDISAICTAAWYALNIVDAAVDAHLFEWNMKDDLNVSWHPTVITMQGPNYPRAAAGLSIRLGF